MQSTLNRLIDHPEASRAAEFVFTHDETTLAAQVELTEIPAPPFGEARRAARMAEILAETGCEDVHLDAVGNVVAARSGAGDGEPLVVSAHLDTVFPADTDVRVRRDGDRLHAPGISDDGRGLAALVTIARAFQATGLHTVRPLMFVATVGEEGLGDLRGVKHLFAENGAGRGSAGFISLDGAGLDRIVVKALGSRRYRVTATGPGGHSWVDWGTANPIHALTRFGGDLTGLELTERPRSTLTLARIGGGKSINAIPQNAWLEIDTRSASSADLTRLEASIRALVDAHAQAEPDLTFTTDVIGDRPGGGTDVEAPLVRAAVAATRQAGGNPTLATSSTDANIPMSLGIPAVTLGCGGDAGQAHTSAEWYHNRRGPEGIVRGLHTILLAAGLAESA